MLFNKIKRTFNIQTIVAALNYRPLTIIKTPYEEIYSFWQLFYVSRGQMSIVRDGKTETISAGQIIFRPPNKTSTMIYPDNCELYLGILDFICAGKAITSFGEHPITLDGKEKLIIEELIKESAGFYKTLPSDPLWTELISSGLESFLVRLFGRINGVFSSEGQSEKSNTKNNVSESISRINDLLEERRFSNITIDEIAALVNESPNVIMKRYKKETGESIMEHFLELKLHTAITLVLSSDMNFTEISDLLGFSSVNYFSKFFKKRTGMTPTEYSRRG
ncbi:MAG: AraC family transcriptional regulator [Clostridia bacterium]|nr:AraC family transcriptional regulator [Clostridia bacterium]